MPLVPVDDLEDVPAVVDVEEPVVLDVLVLVELSELVVEDVLLPLDVEVDDPHADVQSTPKGHEPSTLT